MGWCLWARLTLTQGLGSPCPSAPQYVKAWCPRAALPPLYALELLTIYAWEVGAEEEESFRLDEGLTTVMELLQDYQFLCIYWTKFYSLDEPVLGEFIRRKLKGKRYRTHMQLVGNQSRARWNG